MDFFNKVEGEYFYTGNQKYSRSIVSLNKALYQIGIAVKKEYWDALQRIILLVQTSNHDSKAGVTRIENFYLSPYIP